jgi:CDP-glucose 4,6-dehydratase
MEKLVGMEDLFWKGKSVFLTGHTGFKGGWLALWLHSMGAKVHGYALDPLTTPALLDAAGIASVLASDTRADLSDLERLTSAVSQAGPDVVFHLAAQPLVRESYKDPIGTMMTNVMGTAHLLEAARSCDSIRAVVCITTDKVYQNREWVHPYRESDRLGGHDPYSASKGASEIVAASYRSSFFNQAGGHAAMVATARAGNVIGGGDWAADRLVPDCLRSFGEGRPVHLRSPDSVRPWQHVLEPLSGYLSLARKLCEESGGDFANAWNFGPDPAGDAPVGEVADKIAAIWGDSAVVTKGNSDGQPHEAGLLSLDSSRARCLLGWAGRWSLDQALEKTVAWHKAWLSGEDMNACCLSQIAEYNERP